MKIFCYALAITVCCAVTPARVLAQRAVTYQDLLNADKTPQDWLMYGGDYQSQRGVHPEFGEETGGRRRVLAGCQRGHASRS